MNPIIQAATSKFAMLLPDLQKEIRDTLDEVNRKHLHCTDAQTWQRVSLLMLEQMSVNSEDKRKDPDTIHDLYLKKTIELRERLESTFRDPDFTDQILMAFQTHISAPFEADAMLVGYLYHWIISNRECLPLGLHLMPAFIKDMEGTSAFARKIMKLGQKGNEVNPNAQCDAVRTAMAAFLADVAEANNQSLKDFPKVADPKAVVIFSLKFGAGGHIAPHRAMAARLAERNFKVETIHYDTDLNPDNDAYQVLGVTFEDGEPMTEDLHYTRWVAQKHNTKVANLVSFYVDKMKLIHQDEFRDYSGRELLDRLRQINPALIVTTLAYHWMWKAVAYRLSSVKTFMVASDVFFHSKVLKPWYRQLDFSIEHHQIHCGVMTDDIDLLRDEGRAHDEYWEAKHPGKEHQLWAPTFNEFVVDRQISVIGAPINPSIKAITDPIELEGLRKKWKVSDGSMSVCISRGRYGNDADLKNAIECYRTNDPFPKPVVLHVVCGENKPFYERIVAGEFNNLGPNITVQPHPLLAPGDFGEVRSISIADDIKAGGGSTFEGWYLISQGVKSYLLLTPGPELWWELVNCWAMKKWMVGQVFNENESKVKILHELISGGPKTISNKFPDWKPPFDAAVDTILKGRINHVV